MIGIAVFVGLTVFITLLHGAPSDERRSESVGGFEELEANTKDPAVYRVLETLGSILSVKQQRLFNTLGWNLILSVIIVCVSRL